MQGKQCLLGGLVKRQNGALIYSPSDLITFFDSPFASCMDRLALELQATGQSHSPLPPPRDAQAELIAQKGTEHELAFLAKLRASGLDVCEIDHRDAPHENTARAIREGRQVIYQAALAHDGFAGFADFLFREDEPSPELPWTYRLADTKLARKPKPYFLLQLCAYAEMLAPMQGRRPPRLEVITGDSARTLFRTDDFFFYYQAVKRAFLEAQRAFNPRAQPVPEPSDEHRQWTERAEQILAELDHPIRVAGITRQQLQRLAAAGIDTFTKLATAKAGRVPRMEPRTFERLRAQARLQRESANAAVPLWELLDDEARGEGLGLALLPPPSSGDVFFDMEGYPLVEGGLEYLFGATTRRGGEFEFKDFWATSPRDEQRAFEQFIDWVWARFQADPSMHIFHYAAYEVTALRRLMGKFGSREREVDSLLRARVFVDLFQVVRQSLRVGTKSYSIKEIERLYRPLRAGAVATAGESVVEFARWLEAPDGADHHSSAILRGIRDYNCDDCESTAQLYAWLRERQLEAGITYRAQTSDGDASENAPSPALAADALTARLLAQIPEVRDAEPERWRVHELLAHLCSFHRRESKPYFWELYARREMDEQQLIEDPDCLGGLVRTKKPVGTVKKSFLYEYAFDPSQETKLREDDDWAAAHDEALKGSLFAFDGVKGRATLKTTAGELPARMSLIPADFVSAKIIEDSIARVADAWEQSGKLPGHLQTLLGREPPRLKGCKRGAPVLRDEGALIPSASEAVATMQGTTLAIQGPPGCGKTHVSAAVIAHLIGLGHRVGVSSNGHRAIEHLMSKTIEAARAQGLSIRATKIGGDDEADLFDFAEAAYAASVGKVVFSGDEAPQLVGGTAWAFSSPAAQAQLDYLFVDEAGQVSLANIVGMSPSTKNLVLVGDPMQLPQPLQGSHPGESGSSALEYLMQGAATLPPELGIFLPRTHRLHPSLCTFISESIYEGRLLPEPHTAARVIAGGGAPEALVPLECGVQFVPVEHEGNTQESEEEVAQIVALVAELRRRRVAGPRGETRPLADRDILVVAPYNLQVNRLQFALPGLRVGTVDLFQGQEAPVVIVSMCASSAESAPRGLDFIFNPNRLNVAISRAQSLAVVVASPRLLRTRVSTVEQMRRVNLFCRLASPADSHH